MSELVVAEAKAGNPDAAAKRLELLLKTSELKTIGSVNRLAAALIAKGALPNKAQVDALHISIAAVHNMDYLLTWNCRHIDDPANRLTLGGNEGGRERYEYDGYCVHKAPAFRLM